MTTAPTADQLRLLDVADMDVRLAQLSHARRTLPQLAALREAEVAGAALRDDLVRAATDVSDLARETTRAEEAVRQVRERAARNTARLEAGASAKDAEALTRDLEALARRQDELEETELEVMERAESAGAREEDLRSRTQVAAAHRAELVAQRDAAAATIDVEGRAVLQRRAAAVIGLDAALLAQYDEIRARSGRGAAPLVGHQCQGCRTELSVTEMQRVRAAPPDEVLRCEECERILVRVPERTGGAVA